jgi:hypothetical protein
MGHLIELVFDEMPSPTAEGIVSSLVSFAEVCLSAAADGVERERNASVLGLVRGASSVVSAMFQRMTLPGYGELKNVAIRVLKSGDRTDVELNVNLSEVERPRAFAEALFLFAARVSELNGAASYYAGLEPAVDEDTRLFTGNKRGPYQFPER